MVEYARSEITVHDAPLMQVVMVLETAAEEETSAELLGADVPDRLVGASHIRQLSVACGIVGRWPPAVPMLDDVDQVLSACTLTR